MIRVRRCGMRGREWDASEESGDLLIYGLMGDRGFRI